MTLVAEAVLAAFTVSNSARMLAYLPQLIRIARARDGAAAVSCVTWTLFGVSHLSTAAYASVCIGDMRMAAIFVGNALFCVAIVLMTLQRRKSLRRAAS